MPMTTQAEQVLDGALHLAPVERAELVERILASFTFPSRSDIDAAWSREAEERIDAYEAGQLPSTPAMQVFERVDGSPASR